MESIFVAMVTNCMLRNMKLDNQNNHNLW